MGNVIPLKVKKGTVREHLLEIAVHQARVQGKSLVQYLKELQAQAERKGKGDASLPSIPRQVSREKYVYLGSCNQSVHVRIQE